MEKIEQKAGESCLYDRSKACVVNSPSLDLELV